MIASVPRIELQSAFVQLHNQSAMGEEHVQSFFRAQPLAGFDQTPIGFLGKLRFHCSLF
jgi:hypothetical protein